MLYTFRNRMALTLIRLAFALAALVLAPAIINAAGGCSGGSMGPTCTRLPDIFGSLAFGLYAVCVFSGLYLLAPLAVPLLLLGGIAFEIDTRRRGRG